MSILQSRTRTVKLGGQRGLKTLCRYIILSAPLSLKMWHDVGLKTFRLYSQLHMNTVGNVVFFALNHPHYHFA